MPGSDRVINIVVERDISLLYWALGAGVALAFLMIVTHILRKVYTGRVSQVHEFGMDFDAVAKMLDKGLLTQEEAKRVKAVLTRHFGRLYEQRLGGQLTGVSGGPEEPTAAADMSEWKPSVSPGGRPQARTEPGKAGFAQAAQPSERSPAAAKELPGKHPTEDDLSHLPLDVLDMYRMGMITDEEMAALRRFYAARARESKRREP